MLLRFSCSSRAYGEVCSLMRQLSASTGSSSACATAARDYSSSGSGSNGDGAPGTSSPSLDDSFQRRVADLSSGGDGLTATPSWTSVSIDSAMYASSSNAPGASGFNPAGPQAPGAGSGAAGTPSNSSSSSSGAAPGSRSVAHPLYGYAVLGGINPETADQEAGAQQPQLHPRRSFKPGDTYNPEDLDPFGAGESGAFYIPLRRPGAPPPYRVGISRQEVTRDLDYRNTSLLKHFVSESGRLRPRRQTGLPPVLHRRVSKSVKLSRQMALMPFEMVVGDAGANARSRMQEYEAARQSLKLGSRLGRDGGSGGDSGGSRSSGRGGGARGNA